jgi:dTDP-4-amino-4,6-dideoxygalactose transaminase
MQFIDLKAQYAALQHRIDVRIRNVLEHGKFIQGPEVQELEEELANFTGIEHVVCCGNGTDALHLALRALDIGPGDVVVTTPFSFFATAEAIELVGARTAFADIDPETFNIDPGNLDDTITRLKRSQAGRVAAVITVDLFGLPADYQAIEPICRDHGVKLVEDAAQGFGGECGGRMAGAFGDVATTSFFPSKPLGCYGDGGAMFTHDGALGARLKSLRSHGQGSSKYDNVEIGLNSRLDSIQAAILLTKMTVFAEEIQARRKVADRYSLLLSNKVVTPAIPDGFASAWAQYSVLLKDIAQRDRAMEHLKMAGIPSMIYYAKPLHLQGALAYLGHERGDFPVSEEVSDRIISLPMHPYLSTDDQDGIASCLTEFLVAEN